MAPKKGSAWGGGQIHFRTSHRRDACATRPGHDFERAVGLGALRGNNVPKEEKAGGADAFPAYGLATGLHKTGN